MDVRNGNKVDVHFRTSMDVQGEAKDVISLSMDVELGTRSDVQ